MKIRIILFFLIWVSSCKPRSFNSASSHTQGTEDDIFSDSGLPKLTVHMSPKDYESMRFEGRDMADKVNECKPISADDPYQEYDVKSAIFNGENLGTAKLKKKGYQGSLSAWKPSFKLKKLKKSSTNDLKKISLNSDRQDPSHIRQCLAYWFFERAGVAAPKCGHAEVSFDLGENTQNLGVYTIIEEPDSALKRLGFKNPVLIEGTHADFDPVGIQRFEVKTNEDSSNGTNFRTQDIQERLRAIQNILQTDPNDEKFMQLSKLINLDSFFKYWATEVIIGHWDGYANNTNNFLMFIPENPDGSLDRLQFFPWGTDGTFSKQDIINRNNKDRLFSVSAAATLPNWLIKHPPARAKYFQSLKNLIQNSWNTEADQTFRRLEGKLEGVSADLKGSQFQATKKRIQEYLSTQKLVIEAELQADLSPKIAQLQKGKIDCWTPIAEISGSISATHSASPFLFSQDVSGQTNLRFELIKDDGQKSPVPVNILGTSFSMRQVLENKDVTTNVLFTTQAIPGAQLAFSTITEQGIFGAGKTLRHLGYSNTGVLQVLANPNAGDAGWLELGLLGGGHLEIQSGSVTLPHTLEILSEKASTNFKGKIYSKFPLSIILAKLKK